MRTVNGLTKVAKISNGRSAIRMGAVGANMRLAPTSAPVLAQTKLPSTSRREMRVLIR